MRWYRIEFYSKEHACTRSAKAFAVVNRISVVERQYSTQGRAQAAADKMARSLQRNGITVAQWDVTPL